MLGDWISACAPGEFETQAALVLGFSELLPHFPQVLVDVVDALIDRLPLIGIVLSEEQRHEAITCLSDWGLPAHLMHFVSMPVRGMWVRDYGPSFVRWSDGSITILDAEYALAERRNDDYVPTALASLLKVPVIQVPLAIEGGNLLSNGQGLCLTTSIVRVRNQHRRYDDNKIRAILDEYYGFYQGACFSPLKGEQTCHADMFSAFTAPNVAVVGAYDPSMDADNAYILDHNAAMLRGQVTRCGPLQVVRIPMPYNRDGYFRTYTNVIFANGVLLVPSYPDMDQTIEKKAFNVYRELLPDWEIIGIDCSEMIRARGALRCMSINIPWLKDRFVLPTPQRGQRLRRNTPCTAG